MNDNVIRIPPPASRTDFQKRLQEFRDRPKQPTLGQEVSAENERLRMMDEMRDALSLLRMKMAAIGGTEWAAEMVETEAREARTAANKFPS